MNSHALQTSWDRVTRHGDQVALYFYSHIFVSHPEVRSMFPLSMAGQRDKFVSALGRVVSQADQIEGDAAAFLRHLGRDHRKYAVVAEHYDAVGASLCATLKHFLGSAWDEELAAEWTAAYQVIARIMVEAAEISSETSPDSWEAEVVSVERRTMDLTLLTIRPDQPVPVQPRPVGVDADPATAPAMAVLQPGERASPRRFARPARPADRRGPGEHGRRAVPEGRGHREAGGAGG